MNLFKFIFLASLFSFNTFGAKRNFLFECAHYKTSSPVDYTRIYEVTKGAKTTYEVDVHAFDHHGESSFTKRVNLLTKYDGKILEFTTGNFRIKIDYVRTPISPGTLWAFGRIPEYDIHSFDWTCKQYGELSL